MTNVQPSPLAGQAALVTGGSRNIGRAIALALAEAGADIAILGRSDRSAAEGVAEEVRALGRKAQVLLADVADEQQAAEAVSASRSFFGKLDILVCNAAVRRQTPLIDMTATEWREVLGVALDGAFHLVRAALPDMIARAHGRIVTLGGISTHIGTPNRAHVAAAKAGLEGFTRAVAIEHARQGITANCVAPGSIDTARGASAGARPNNLGGEAVPVGRMGRPEEVAAAVKWLCLPEAAYVTGQTIHVNGGIWMP